ncbi:MAG: ComF family protein [Vicinamibacterales bacterium]
MLAHVALLTASNTIVRTLLAPTCAACGGLLLHPLEGPVCAGCWRALPRLTPPWCVRCGDALPARLAGPHCVRCRRHESALALSRSAGVYDGSLRQIIHAFKYGGRRVLGARLARLMREAGVDLLAGADAVIPVPLHPWRALGRGFNQADDLARGLGRPVWRVLRRTRHGPPQAALPAAERQGNVDRAYALRLSPWSERRLLNRSVVLVDDVMTTGATLEACARVLAAAGVRRVTALTAARAVAGPPRPPPPTRHPSAARR